MTGRRVLRFEVPVDDQWHLVANPGVKVGPIAARRADVVEFWAISREDHVELFDSSAEFRVYGTGHTIEDDTAAYVGTCLAASGALVWHLFKREVATS